MLLFTAIYASETHSEDAPQDTHCYVIVIVKASATNHYEM